MNNAVEPVLPKAKERALQAEGSARINSWAKEEVCWMKRKSVWQEHSGRWYTWGWSWKNRWTWNYFGLHYYRYVLVSFARALCTLGDHKLQSTHFVSKIVIGILFFFLISILSSVMIQGPLIAQFKKNHQKWCVNLVGFHFYLSTTLFLEQLQPERNSLFICVPW